MFCPKCGKINPDNGEICSGCGASLKTAVETVSQKKGHNVLRAVIIFAIVVILVVAVLFFFNGCGKIAIPEKNMSF